MVAGDQHQRRAQHHNPVVKERMEARKGNAGIVAQNIGRVNNILLLWLRRNIEEN